MKTPKRVARILVPILAAILVTTATIPATAQTSQTAQTFEKAVAAYEQGAYVMAFVLFGAAAEEGHAEAQFSLGMMYARGEGVEKNETQAVRWLRLAAKQGYAYAQDILDNMSEIEGATESVGGSDASGDSDIETAQTFDEAVAAYERGDYTTALRGFSPVAERGNALAQVFLALMYVDGRGVPQNDVEAIRWYRKAAEQGNAPAQYGLGSMYGNGRGVSQSDSEAVRWFRLAAEQNVAAAQYDLAVMYANDRGVPQNDTEAVRWFRLAAEQGYAKAQDELGLMYFNGRGVPQNDAEAVRWFRQAANPTSPTHHVFRRFS